MSFTEKYVEEIRYEIQASAAVLEEARDRRDAVLEAVGAQDGVLRKFSSGSLAHRTVIKPVSDADCGVVLDRRVYRHLGPDGERADGPARVVEAIRKKVAAAVAETYPSASATLTKRAIQVTFSDPVTADEDPSVDLIVALDRRDAEGLWIPRLDDDSWDASHPERHTELFSEGSEGLRQIRRRAVRVAKAWNKQFATPNLCSFNIEAIALNSVSEGFGIVESLHQLFTHGAEGLRGGLTPDPAGVSAPIKVEDRQLAVTRLQAAAAGIREAISHDDDEQAVRRALSRVFFEYIEAPEDGSKEDFASRIRAGTAAVGSSASQRAVRRVRSHGNGA